MLSTDQINSMGKWHKSKLMGDHEYIVAQESPQLFHKLADEIRAKSVHGQFKGKTYKYMHHEGYRYWWMGNIINRALDVPNQNKPLLEDRAE